MERKRRINGQVHLKTASKKSHKKQNTAFSEEDEEVELFSWEDYLKKTCSKAVPKSSFKHVQDPVEQGFNPGMKVEALNRNSDQGNTYWVATIVTVSGPLLLLRYDGCDKDRREDFWCDAASEDLQPIGWCARTNHVLVPPESIRHKESNWARFLSSDLKDKSTFAPEHLFHKRTNEDDGILSPGTKVELLNKDDFTSYWVASVVESYGMRLHLRYEGGTDESHDIWIYYLSDRLHELGWGMKHSLVLQAPAVLRSGVYDIAAVTNKVAAMCESPEIPPSALKSKPVKFPRAHNLAVGMKLEAIHPEDPSSICVATVSRILSPVYFQVQIDSLIRCNDKALVFCSHADARNIFPVGWCESHNITLTPPPGYHAFPFSWERYLKWTVSVATPVELFDLSVPEHQFDVDLKLEAVDQTNPAVITVATVTQVVGRTLWVHLDGIQDNSVEHIYDIESYDLLPAGWGSTNGHPLQTPKITFIDRTDNNRLLTLRVTRQRQKQMDGSSSELSDTEEKNKSKELQTEKKSKPEPEIELDKVNEQTSSKKESEKQNVQIPVNKVNNLNNEESVDLNPRTSPEKSNVTNKPASNSVCTQSVAKIKPYIPESKTSLIPPGESKKKQKEEQRVTSSVDLTQDDDDDDNLKTSERGVIQAPKNSICIYLKASCRTGPYLSQAKLKLLNPSVMGPYTPDVALRKLLECIVKSSHRSQQVLEILSSEREKRTFGSILLTLCNRLNFCRNMFTRRKILFCSLCDTPAKMTLKSSKTPLLGNVGTIYRCTGLNKHTDYDGSDDGVPAIPLTSKSVTTSYQQSQYSSNPIISQAITKTTTTVLPQPVAISPVKSVSSQPMTSISKTGPPVDIPSKNTVSCQNKPVKPALNRAGTVAHKPVKPDLNRASTVAQSQMVVKSVIPQSSDVSSVAFVMPSGSHISTWNVTDVVQYIRTTDCSQYANIFLEQEIDGKALMLLSVDDFHKGLDITLGPAIKLHNYVQKLYERPK